MGKVAALAAARTGSAILRVARDPQVGKAVADELHAAGAREVTFLSADLSRIAGMKAAAERVATWKPELHGILHSAMSAFSQKSITPRRARTGLRQPVSCPRAHQPGRARCADRIGRRAPCPSGRAVPYKMGKPDLDGLQFAHRKWSFFKAILSTHVLGFEFLNEAGRRWANRRCR